MAEKIIIRTATGEDVKKVFTLSNDDTVRANSIQTEKINYDNHVKWFFDILQNEQVKFYIAEDINHNFIGQVRFSKQDNRWVVSISLVREFRKKHLGKTILLLAITKSGIANFSAWVKKENIASLKLFESVGFVAFSEENIHGTTYKVYHYDK